MTLGKNTRLALKWICYGGILLFCLGLQTEQSLFYINGVKPILLVPAVVSLSFFESELSSALFGLGAGLLWDVAAGKIFGFYGMILMFICAACALLSIYIIKGNLLNAVFLCTAGIFCCLCWDFLFYYLIWGYEKVWLIFQKYLFVTLYSIPFTPLIYLLIRKIAAVFGQPPRI